MLQKVYLLQSQIADACFHGLKPVLAMLIFKESGYLCYSLIPHDHKSAQLLKYYTIKKKKVLVGGWGVEFLILLT